MYTITVTGLDCSIIYSSISMHLDNAVGLSSHAWCYFIIIYACVIIYVILLYYSTVIDFTACK